MRTRICGNLMFSRRAFAKAAAGASLLASSGQFLPTPLTEAQQVPSGKIAFGRSGDIWRWQNGDTANVFEDGSASNPRWSPQGSDLLYVKSGDSFSDLHIRYLGSGQDVQLTFNQPADQQGTEAYANNSSWAIDPFWASSGLIGFASDYFTDSGAMMLFLISNLSDGAYLAPSAQTEGNLDSVTLSSDGLIAGYTVRSSDVNSYNMTYVALRDLGDGTAYPIHTDSGAAFDPAISPDNTQVALSIRSSNSDQSDIWLASRETGELRQVTENAQATSPCWCPGGSWLAYIR